MAARQIQTEPVAIQLRYLQTLVEIGTEKNTTVVFPVPIHLIASTTQLLKNMSESNRQNPAV